MFKSNIFPVRVISHVSCDVVVYNKSCPRLLHDLKSRLLSLVILVYTYLGTIIPAEKELEYHPSLASFATDLFPHCKFHRACIHK